MEQKEDTNTTFRKGTVMNSVNCLKGGGPGTIDRIIRRNGVNTWWNFPC